MVPGFLQFVTVRGQEYLRQAAGVESAPDPTAARKAAEVAIGKWKKATRT
jgi:hypothetical protein